MKKIIISTIVIIILIVVFMFMFSANENKYEDMNINTENNNMSKNNTQNTENEDKVIFALMKTNFGDIKLELFKEDAPNTVENFVKLSKNGFYNGTLFHRVIPQFMIQGGDPNSKSENWSIHGTGGPGYTFADEFNDNKLVAGTLAMANAGPNTNGSQFFIVTAEATPWLDGKHTAFGKVVQGMNVVKKIEATETTGNQGNPPDHPMEDIIIESITIQN